MLRIRLSLLSYLLLGLHIASANASSVMLGMPLDCAQPSSPTSPCPTSAKYSAGAYTAGMINTVLDHQMAVDASGRYPYRTFGTKDGLNGVITAFNGETVSGPTKATLPTDSNIVCVGGSINLSGMTKSGGCGTNYTSYDEHPGYDYKAAAGSTVKAAADGIVINNNSQRCVLNGIASCDIWGYVGIDHGGVITQYGHLSQILVTAGQTVHKGDVIGYSGSTAPPTSPVLPHLHFEVLARIADGLSSCVDQSQYASCRWAAVDPYGWTGSSNTANDPIYSRVVYGIASKKLWLDPVIVFQPGPEGFDTVYGTVYAAGPNGNAESLYDGGWGDYYYDFFRWDLSSLPTASSVSTVKLWLYFTASGNDPAFQVRRVTSNWDEATLTRNNYPAATAWGSWTGIVSDGWHSIDITELYKNWQNGVWPNYGIELAPTRNNNTNGLIHSSDYLPNPALRPKLVITTQ